MDPEVKYCVTAIIDLAGFSSHLEVGYADIRTNIGQQAISRLHTLVDSLKYLETEKKSYKDYYPAFQYFRANDSIILNIDLPQFLMPSIGDFVRNGISPNEINKFFDINSFHNDREFVKKYKARTIEETANLRKFIGIIARLHSFINRTEAAAFFPGAKTIVSSGYRREFYAEGKEDVLSANFAFSNSYLANRYLHGPKLFLDNNISKMLCTNRYAQNIVRFAAFSGYSKSFDPMIDYKDTLYEKSILRKGQEIEVSLLRRNFIYREFNSTPLAYLQIVDHINPYLTGRRKSRASSHWLSIINAIRNGPEFKSESEDTLKYSSIYSIRTDIENDVRIFPEIVETGKSSVNKALKKKYYTDIAI